MTIIKHSAQRVAVFIDAQNLYHSAKHLYGAKVNFGDVVTDAVAGRALVRATAYVIATEEGSEQSFFDALTKVGIEAKHKDLQIFAGGQKKADWDVGLAIDAVKLAPKLDTVILISGDGDFIPLVEYLQMNEGCQVEVVSFGRSTSGALIEVADHFTDLDDATDKYLIGYRGGGRGFRLARGRSTTEGRGGEKQGSTEPVGKPRIVKRKL
ncbi:MAG TPA: NYN domain-containing protein [Candidatus Paceibacterota bacterium]|nr:NYN domain-containing protein [Candidatus Paceibacterota bacterium]